MKSISHQLHLFCIQLKTSFFYIGIAKVKAWLPPGGHIENNETPVEAVKRETFEEAGIHIKLYNFNSSMSEIPFSDVRRNTCSIHHTFRKY